MSNQRLVLGVGVNDSDYVTAPYVNGKQVTCPFYLAWKDMLTRCYNKNYQKKRPTYEGCTVTPEWHGFMAFRSWMMRQDWRGKALDKDILVQGCKVYSPTTCVFVDRDVNALLTSRTALRGEFPIGVSFDKSTGKYMAQASIEGRTKQLGRYDTPMKAHRAWQLSKAGTLDKVALTMLDERVKNALMARANQLRLDAENGHETFSF